MPFRAAVLTIFVLSGCASANAGNLRSDGPPENQSVEFVVLNGIQEALVVFALWDTRRSTLLGSVSSFSTAEFDIPLQGQAVALSIESLLPGLTGNRDRGPRGTPSTELVSVSAGDRIEWIVTDPGRRVEYGGLVRDDLRFRPPRRRPPIPGVTRRGGDYVVRLWAPGGEPDQF